MIEKIYLFSLMICFVIFFSCSTKPSLTITDKENGSKVGINNGDILEIKLKAQISTGYSWKVVTENKDLELVGKPGQVSMETENKTGGIDYQIFKFKAKNKGESELKFEYAQPWDKKSKVEKKFSIVVNVR